MKIGKFSEINKLSIDTIRHYMDLGLIVPEKQGGQYFFDSACQKDLESILEFKDMGFSLSEIKSIFLYKSFSKMALSQEDLYYKAFFVEKYKKIQNDIARLEEISRKLENKLKKLSEIVDKDKYTLGVDIRALELFRCIKCRNELVLYDASVNKNQIIDGKLKCSCGEEYIIDSGILKVGTPYKGPASKFDNGYIIEYISDTDPAYLDNLYKGLEWGSRKLSLCSLDNRVMLELGTGIGFFLRYIYDQLPANCVYIAVDNNMERHKFLKGLLEGSGCKKNIIFVCSDFLEVPIKEKSIDIIVDISGTSNYSFEHESFLLDSADFYIKNDAYLFGSYILFKNFSRNSLIEKKYRANFMLESIKSRIKDLRYEALDERTSDYVDKGGKYENYFVEGEKVYTYSFFGKR